MKSRTPGASPRSRIAHYGLWGSWFCWLSIIIGLVFLIRTFVYKPRASNGGHQQTSGGHPEFVLGQTTWDYHRLLTIRVPLGDPEHCGQS